MKRTWKVVFPSEGPGARGHDWERRLTFHIQGERLLEGLLGEGLAKGFACEGETIVLPSHQECQVGHGDVASVQALAGSEL